MSTVKLMPPPSQGLHGGRLLQRAIEIPQHAELAQDDGPRRVAVEQLDPPVLETKDIAARRVHPVARGRKDSLGKPQRPVVSALQCQLDDHHVTPCTSYVHVV